MVSVGDRNSYVEHSTAGADLIGKRMALDNAGSVLQRAYAVFAATFVHVSLYGQTMEYK